MGEGGRHRDPALEDVRAELRRMGYLDHGFGRYLLQDALRPRRPWRTLLHLTARVAVAGGALLALAAGLGLALANGSLRQSPFDLIPLFLHLLPLATLICGGTFLALSAALVVVLRLSHVRRIEVVSFAAALAAGIGAVALAVSRSAELWGGASSWGRLAFAAALLAVAAVLVKVVESGLLALAIRLTDQAPRRRWFSRRWLAAALAVGLALLLLPAVLEVRRLERPAPLHLAQASGERVLLIGIDGVLVEEVDYLLAAGELPALQALAREGRRWEYRRPPVLPATFWTTVATGREAADHGVLAVDAFQPLGIHQPLARSGPLRWYWTRVAEPLGLASHRPVLAARRRVPAFWELAARGGRPVAAINWWGTYPAEPLAGLVVAHGGFGLLRQQADGAVASRSQPELARRVEELVHELSTGEPDPGLAAALGPGAAAELLERALVPDDFYRRVLSLAEAASPRAAALYLPASDLAAAGWTGGDIAFADVVRGSLRQADDLVARLAGGYDTVAVVLDPGRRGGERGRVLLSSRSACSAAEPVGTPPARVAPAQVAAVLLRLLGLPQSRELPAPPNGCSWPEPPDVVGGYGPRDSPSSTPRSGDAYLDNLRSLGYL